MYNVRDLQGIQTKLLSLSFVFYIIESKVINFFVFKKYIVRPKMQQRRPCFHGGTVSPMRKSSLLDLNSATTTSAMTPHVSSLTWWPRRCATGEAWPNIMLSCQAGRPCDVRAHRNRLTTTWPPHVITRYFGFLLLQHYDTDKHSYSHGFFQFFWRVKVCWNGYIYW